MNVRSPRVAFVRGILPRSGTNFFLDVLACNSKVVRSPGKFWEFAPFRFHGDLENYVAKIEQCKHANEFSRKEFLPYIGQAWVSYLDKHQSNRDGLLIWKEPSVSNLQSMYDIFPNARAVIVVRDGRDIISSALKAGFVLPQRSLLNHRHWRRFLPDADFRILCHLFAKEANRLLEFVSNQDTEEGRNVFQISRFEQLIATPQNEIAKLHEFTGLALADFDWQKYQKLNVRGSSFLRDPMGSMNFGEGVSSTIDFLPVGRWTEWPKRWNEFFSKTCGKEMRDLGYNL